MALRSGHDRSLGSALAAVAKRPARGAGHKSEMRKWMEDHTVNLAEQKARGALNWAALAEWMNGVGFRTENNTPVTGAILAAIWARIQSSRRMREMNFRTSQPVAGDSAAGRAILPSGNAALPNSFKLQTVKKK